MRPETIRRLLGVFVGLAVATVVAAWVTRPRQAPLLCAEDLPGKVIRIEIEGPAGKNVLARSKDAWVVETAKNAPADARLISLSLERLPQVALSEPVTQDAQRYPLFGLGASSAVQLRLIGEKGPLLELQVGKDGPDYPSAYIRLSGKPEVVVAEGLAPSDWNHPAADWLAPPPAPVKPGVVPAPK
ncbi:MAG: DUF4340 domain-containing protein [Elusimicrobia bacterium]|nr:DUF4340 domain-containing protein [Elusimicrobiota bacterium]